MRQKLIGFDHIFCLLPHHYQWNDWLCHAPQAKQSKWCSKFLSTHSTRYSTCDCSNNLGLQRIGLYKTLAGMIAIEVAYGLAFAVLIFRNFIGTIPKEIDEAAIVDGCTGWNLYFRIIFPLLKPVSITIGIIATAAVFNDFTNPLYYLPGDENATLQQTLFAYVSRYSTQYNLLFADILYITAFPLLAFIFFNKRIVSGMTAGSIKG